MGNSWLKRELLSEFPSTFIFNGRITSLVFRYATSDYRQFVLQ